MSNINIILEGVMAFLAAAVLSLLLLLGIIMCSLSGWFTARQRQEQFSQQNVFSHLVGMLLSLMCSIVIMLIILSTDQLARPHTLNLWLDNWVWLWISAILATCPLSTYIEKKLRESKGTLQSGGET